MHSIPASLRRLGAFWFAWLAATAALLAQPTVTTDSGTLSYTENSAASAVSPGLTLSAGTPPVFFATVTISVNLASGEDILSFTNDGSTMGNIAAGAYDSSTGVINLFSSGSSASVSEWQSALRAVRYSNSSDNPSTATRTVSFVVQDGGGQNSPAMRDIAITAVNDGPVNTVPGAQTMNMNTSRTFSSGNSNLISIADVDANSGNLQITLTATNGTVALNAGATGSLATLSGNGSGSVVFTGTLANLNNALNGLAFTPTSGYFGAASLQIATNDQGNTGTGGAQTDTDTVNITVNSVAPTVTSVSASTANGSYKIGDTISVTVAFSQAVTVSGTPTLLLETGAVDRNATYVSGSGSSTLTFNYTVQSGDVSADLDYTSTSALALNGGTIANGSPTNADLTLPAPGAAGSLGANKAIVIDGVAPTVSSVAVPANGTYILGQNLDFTVNWSEAVTVNTAGGTPRIALTLDVGGTVYATYFSGSGTTALVFRYTVASGNSDPTGVTVGALTLNGGTLRDAAGNDAVLTLNSVGATAAVLVDGIAPTVSSVAVPASGTYGSGANLTFTVNFSEAVTVNTAGGTPRIPLTFDTGGTVYATYLSGSGTTALVFRHTVVAGTADPSGIAVGASLDANGGTLRDASSNNAVLTLNSVGSTAAVLVDGIAPTVSSVTVPANGTYGVGQNLDFTVNWSEAVTVNTGGGTPRIALTLDTGGTVDASYLSGSGTTALVFRYTVASGNSDPTGVTVGALTLNGGTLSDAAGNDAVLTLNSVGATAAVLVDGIAPTVSSVAVPANGTYGSGANLNFTVNFSEAVTVNTAGGTPRLAVTLDVGGTVYATYLSGSGTTALVFRYTIVSGNSDPTGIALAASLDANGGTIRDAGANNATLTLNSVGSTAGVLVDGVAAAVLSITRLSATPSKGPSVQFTVTFSEGVTGVDATDFLLTATGTAAGTVSAVSVVSTSVYIVTVTGITGDGTLRLDLKASGTGITDIPGNVTVGAFSAGEVYTIDTTVPVITSAGTLSGVFGGPVSYTATANESPVTFAATGLPGGLSLTTGGALSGTVNSSGNFTATLTATDAAGNVGSRTLAVTIGRSLVTIVVSNLAQTYDGQPHPVTVTTTPAGQPVTVAYAGSATVPTGAGTYAVVATVDAPNYFGTGSGTLVIAKAAQTVSFPSPAPVSVNVAAPLAATASSGLPITYSIVSGNATLAGSSLTVRDASPVVVRATQAGDANLEAASATVTVSAGKLPQTITFAALTDRRGDEPAFALTATASSGLPVTFTLVSGPATLAGSLVTLGGTAGTVTIRATQAGDATYDPAPEVVRSFEVTAAVIAERLINLSTRGPVNLAGGRPLIVGFVISSPGQKRLLLRAAGPALTGFGVAGAATNPRLQIFDSAGRVILDNDDWSGADVAAAASQVGAFALAAGSRDAALVATLAPGAYSMQVLDNGAPGVALAEIYDLGDAAEPQRVINLSSRGTVDPAAPFIDGFVIAGRNPKRVLIRAVGPGLGAFGVAGTLADPRLAVFSGATLVAQNDDWSVPQPVAGQPAPATGAEISAAAAAAGAFALPAGSRDAAVVLTLAPGAYSAQAAVATGAAGAALVEVYELP